MREADEIIQQDVLDELSFDPRVEAADIGVVVQDGAVVLEGHVRTYAERRAAEEAVRKVSGVKAVANEVVVHLPDHMRVDDGDLAKRVAHVLTHNVTLPPDAVQARVADGFVTLKGEVPRDHQRRTLSAQVAHLRGVRGVFNDVAVRQQVTPSDVKAQIERALQRSAGIEADRIIVLIDGGRVTLDGDVKAFYERDLAEATAWAVPGVVEVVDNIRVG